MPMDPNDPRNVPIPLNDPEKAPWMPPVINNVAPRKSNTISDAEIRAGTARSAAENKAKRDAWNKAHPSKTYTPGKKKEVLPLPKPKATSSKPKAVMKKVTLVKPGKNTLTVGPARAPIPLASNKGKSSAASSGGARGTGSPNPKTPAKTPAGAKPQPMPRINEGARTQPLRLKDGAKKPSAVDKIAGAAAAAKRNNMISTARAAMPKTPAATATQKLNWAAAKSNAGSTGRAMGLPATPKATPKQTAAWNTAKSGGVGSLLSKFKK